MKASTGILLVGGLVVLGIAAKSKINTWKLIAKQLKATPTGVSSIKITDGKLKFNINVSIFNPTGQDFSPNLALVKLKKVIVNDKAGNYVGQITIDRSSVNIPKGSSTTIKNLPVELPIAWNLQNIQNLVQMKPTDYKTNIVLSILGSEITI